MTDHAYEEDNYLPSEIYEQHTPEGDDFVRFEYENEWYFGYFRDNKVFLRSEGYSNEPARHNGIESVRTNMWDDSHFTVDELPGGKWILKLHAANRKEIARSREYDSEKEARAQLPSKHNKALHHEDDYLVCKAYEGHPREEEHSDMAKFEKDGDFLFAVYEEGGRVLLRSERYPTAAARDTGFESVVKNRMTEERYSIEEKAERFFLVLKAANHQEIARSCPFESEHQAAYFLPSAIQLRADKMAASTHKSDDDNYLGCEEYRREERSAEQPDFSVFEKDGEYYFALTDDSGEILLRSEGYATPAARQNGIESVVKNKSLEERYSTEEKFGKYFVKLHAGNNREIARSCPKSEAEAAALIALLTGPDIKEKVAEATATMNEPIGVEKSAFNIWPWLLLLLLAILAFIWFRSCSGDSDQSAAEVADVELPTTPVAEAVGMLDCNLMPILFAFDSDSLPQPAIDELNEMAEIMMNHEGYTGKIMSFTDSVGTFSYNLELSRRRCEAAKNILVAAGVDPERIETDPEAELKPVAINTEDDSGRHFNRRLELMIYDQNGNPACIREEMDIPENLRIR